MEFLCSDCPRNCNVIRTENTPNGFCNCTFLPNIVRAAPHFGEEPCISGTRGSGAIFFSGCNLRCIFCQNHEISRKQSGKPADLNTMVDIIHRLEDQGVHNINFVTPSHHARFLASVIEKAKPSVPVVWNSSGYEKVETLKMLDGLVQIYLPDFKYMDKELARKYSSAPDYPETAKLAIDEMYRQTGDFEFNDEDMMVKGIIVRHLILPDAIDNTKEVIDYISSKYPGDKILFSLMSQYTVMPGLENHPQLGKRISKEENEMMINYMSDCGIENGFFQETESATDEMIPDFDLTGV